MRFDKLIKIIGSVKVSDGMGGYEETIAPVGTFYALTTSMSLDTASKEYGIVAKESLKVFTKDSIPKDIGSVEIDSVIYDVRAFRDFGKKMKTLVVARER